MYKLKRKAIYKLKRKAIAEPVAVEAESSELVRRDVVAPRGHEIKDNSKIVAENVNVLLQSVSANAVQEIGLLISELQISRERVRLEGERVQQQMVEYATLSQSVMQTAKTIAENLRHWSPDPIAPSSAEESAVGLN